MAATTTNKSTSVHDCPFCGIQCAVSASEMASAHKAGKHVRIACHGCGDVFDPVSGLSEEMLDIAICPHCSDKFSVPPLPADKNVALSCPLCHADVATSEMEYHQRDGKVIKKKSALSRKISALFKRKKPVNIEPGVTPASNAHLDVAPTPNTSEATDNGVNFGVITDPSVAEESSNKRTTGNSVVTRLFKSTSKKSNKAKDDLANDHDFNERPTLKTTNRKNSKRPFALASLLVALIIVGIGGAMVLSPTKPAQILEIFMAQQIKPANFSITNAVYERVETSVGKSVVITVTITNSGDTNGIPGTVMVELLNEARQPILSWPVTTNALNVEPGDSRALVTRIFEPPSEFNDIQVTLASN